MKTVSIHFTDVDDGESASLVVEYHDKNVNITNSASMQITSAIIDQLVAEGILTLSNKVPYTKILH